LGESQSHNKGPEDLNPFQCSTKKDPNIIPLNHTKPTSNNLEVKLTPLTKDMFMLVLNASFMEPTHDPPLDQTHKQTKNHAPTHFEHPNST
jgi:hypothetical protein